MRRVQVHYRADQLTPGNHRVELKGPSRTLAWPNICANCGEPAGERITIRKVFRRWRRNPGWKYVIRSCDVPFCFECAERHRALEQRMSKEEVFFMTLKSPTMIAFAGSAALAIWLAPGFWASRNDVYSWVGFLILGVLVLNAIWCAFASWWSTRYNRVPAMTEITRACDFSDNLGNFVVGERHTYAIRNAAFAAEFKAANAHRSFTIADLHRARRKQAVWSTVFLLAIVCSWLFVRLAKG